MCRFISPLYSKNNCQKKLKINIFRKFLDFQTPLKNFKSLYLLFCWQKYKARKVFFFCVKPIYLRSQDGKLYSIGKIITAERQHNTE